MGGRGGQALIRYITGRCMFSWLHLFHPHDHDPNVLPMHGLPRFTSAGRHHLSGGGLAAATITDAETHQIFAFQISPLDFCLCCSFRLLTLRQWRTPDSNRSCYARSSIHFVIDPQVLPVTLSGSPSRSSVGFHLPALPIVAVLQTVLIGYVRRL